MIERGLYRHFKGKLYFVHGVATDAESEETISLVVVYEPLYGEPGRQFIRSVENFLEEVDRPEWGYKGPRFTLVNS